MKKSKLLLIAGLYLTAGLFSCTKEATEPTPQTTDGIQLVIGFDETKVATDLGFNSSFEVGDEIGVFAVRHAPGETAPLQDSETANYANNIKFTYNGTSWETTTPIFRPANGDALDIYAYYPYHGAEGTVNPLKVPHQIELDQSTAANFSKSDLMIGSALDTRSDFVSLKFTHMNAMLEINVSKEDKVPAFDDTFTVKAHFDKDIHKGGADLSLTTASLYGTVLATDDAITLYRVDQKTPTSTTAVYRAIVPNHLTWEIFESKNSIKYSFTQTTQGRKIDFVYDAPDFDYLGSATNVNRENIKLTYHDDPNWMYKVGDVYPYKGTPIGIVYEIDSPDANGLGKQGKIISLDEGIGDWANGFDKAAYMTSNYIDGLVAESVIYNFATTNSFKFSDYYAINWATVKNGGVRPPSTTAKHFWYIPASDEWRSFFAQISGSTFANINAIPGNPWNPVDDAFVTSTQSLREAFNMKLVAADGTEVQITGDADHNPNYYWSSTTNGGGIGEKNISLACFINGHIALWNTSRNTMRYRAIMKF